MNAGTEKRPLLRRPLVLWPVAGLALALVAAGLWAFQPWRMFTTRTVDEAPPTAVAASEEDPGAGDDADGSAVSGEDGAEAESDAEPAVLGEGDFITQEHETSGTATVLELPDGTRHVRLADLATSDGPDLHVWITDQEAGGDWYKYGDGRHVALGELKGTEGDANYEIPADADLDGMTSVVVWCERFSVAFGSAPVEL
ncbi:electron transfer DM13 [Nocardiopsis sp. Huas11]|uniref:DM13 domain-containing protein n=1 Tax=Nocardiopsis sp. Huas11 TaxID=2183912 RepID=UPI000EAC477B|nr:DM13 domain-containing protein [Nocardiopsis sp. Huas11]RKS05349.1 electron transfer DM13 [Nocardiopsis sp. Huas11]